MNLLIVLYFIELYQLESCFYFTLKSFFSFDNSIPSPDTLVAIVYNSKRREGNGGVKVAPRVTPVMSEHTPGLGAVGYLVSPNEYTSPCTRHVCSHCHGVSSQPDTLAPRPHGSGVGVSPGFQAGRVDTAARWWTECLIVLLYFCPVVCMRALLYVLCYCISKEIELS